MDEKYSREIERLYLLMYERLYVYARCTIENDSLAEEAVQETFRIACQKPEALCSSKKPEGWLINALKYVMSNMERSRMTANRILKEYMLSQASDLTVLEDGVKLEILYGSMAEMDEFKLIKEMAVDGKSQLEMAQARHISLDACKKRVQRAKEKLRIKFMNDVTL